MKPYSHRTSGFRHNRISRDNRTNRTFHVQGKSTPTSWERVARWYDGMVGDSGSDTHQNAGIKTVLDLLSIKKGDRILDIGCGQGVLAPQVKRLGGNYIGIDSSKTLIGQAISRHKNNGSFFVADAASLSHNKQISGNAPYDACVFLLSIQDISAADKAIIEAESLLKKNGKIVIFMTHPAFRIPRQSGWGVDRERKLVFRRIDSYLSRLDVPMRTHYQTQKTLTRSFHRPLHYYINLLSNSGISLSLMEEIPDTQKADREENRAARRAHMEIPLFLALLGVKQ